MLDFTTDWFTHNIPNWKPVLAPLRDQAASILEVGSYEGRSAVFFLEHLPKCRITCVDPFFAAQEWTKGYEARFDANIAPFAERVIKVKNWSVPALDALRRSGARFDVIYIDGDHTRHGAFADSVLAWPLLKIGGILIWDDYRWKRKELPSEKRPEHAIDLFLTMFAPCLKERHRGYQVIIEKTAGWPTPGQQSIADLQIRDRPSVGLWRWLRRRLTPPKRLRASIRKNARRSRIAVHRPIA